MAGVAIAGTDSEDPAEHLDGNDDVGDLLDPLVDGVEADETTNDKQKQLDRHAEFDVYGGSGKRSGLRHAGIRITEKTESKHDSSQERVQG